MSQNIQFKRVTYTKDPKYKYFNLSGPLVADLPDSISIEETRMTDRIHSPLVVIDRKRKTYITGLKNFLWDWHYGDLWNGEEKELLIFQIKVNEVVVFHFPGFYPVSPRSFIRQFI
jgi:hypothetical protein